MQFVTGHHISKKNVSKSILLQTCILHAAVFISLLQCIAACEIKVIFWPRHNVTMSCGGEPVKGRREGHASYTLLTKSVHCSMLN